MTVIDDGYAACRALHRRHGTTYYWATQLLPRHRRPHVDAFYGFCRYADELVDDVSLTSPAERRDALANLSRRFHEAWAERASTDPILAALVNSMVELDVDPSAIDRFLRAMAMDLTVTRYETWTDLCGYMDGSAAVIGELMLPVLAPGSSAPLRQPARQLGIAFQLTNFLRDVGEDLDRGRVYLPAADLRRFGADPSAGCVTPQWAAAMRFEIERARRLYLEADVGIALLPRRAAACVRTARVLYSRILDRIEANGYDVFTRRARVATPVKLAVAGRHLVPALVAPQRGVDRAEGVVADRRVTVSR